jgi:pimeloyl-ACP methyl ester carboxylesterase
MNAKKYLSGAAILGVAFLFSSPRLLAGAVPKGFTARDAEVNGVRIHYSIGGKGSPVVLLHGYAQTSHMWNPIMPLLASNHTVIVPDLRGAGDSSKPESGYDKKNMAVDIHELVTSLGFKRASIVGHDIGLMVAYAYAAQFPQETERLVLMDAFLPGVGDWKNVWLMRDLWHFHFYGEVPLALVKGRERTYFEHFWNDFAALSATPLPMPVFVLGGEKSGGEFLIAQAKLAASNVQGKIIPGSGHWLIDEAPRTVIPALIAYINEPVATASASVKVPQRTSTSK